VRTTRVYRVEGGGVEVACDEASTRAWLDEALEPWFAGEPAAADDPAPDSPRYRVEFARAEDPLRALGVAAGRAPDGERPCFALDTRTLVYPAWSTGEPEGDVVLHDARHASHLAVGPTRARVVGSPGAVAPRVTLMRTVREVAAAWQRRLPGVLALHAAGFAVAGRTVLVLGPKEAGKTTLLLHVLATGEAALVTNDRALVAWRDAAAPPQALGVPTFVRVRPGTLAIFPALARGLPPDLRPLCYSFAELSTRRGVGSTAPAVHDGHAVMTPAQLCRQAGVRPCRGGPLAALLLPERGDPADPADPAGPWQLEKVGGEDACAALLANRYGLAARPAAGHEPTVFEQALLVRESGEGTLGRDAEERSLARRLVAQVPVYRCRVGRTRAPEPGRAAALLRGLSL
jgi:hypothetical protein